MRKLKPQIDQRDHDLVGEEQFMLRPGSGLSLSLSAAPVVQRGLAACGPRTGQLLDQIGEMARRIPVKAGWDKAARAHFKVTLKELVRPSTRHGLGPEVS
ncbi:hypothetical protein [Streptomyces mirabilis]|uniref:hypothetical protein n=1 Tax=Streptomyces mirabilis TaxID=68239 RepID=UPI002E3344E7|nr:hypothetical protein [Streptomyces mirabilis]